MASGMATLAGFVREEDSPDHNRRARDLAEQGRAAYPDSIGGRQCLSTVKSIEAPQYAVHAMASDGPDRRSIGVDYKNLRALHFRAWPMDLKKQIENTDEWDVFPSWRVIEKFVSGSKPAAEWSVELPETTDFEIHRQFVTPPMREPGF